MVECSRCDQFMAGPYVSDTQRRQKEPESKRTGWADTLLYVISAHLLDVEGEIKSVVSQKICDSYVVCVVEQKIRVS